MANDPLDYNLGAWSQSTFPSWQRNWYEAALLETLRTKSILVPFTVLKEDFTARNSGQITYSEVFDMEPQWNSINETDIWFKGGSLDSRSINIDLAMYHNILKFSDYTSVVTYIRNGDIRGLVKEKIGINMSETMDILARNAFLSHPNKTYGGGRASRVALTSSDLFDPDLAELIRTHLEENNIPGVVTTEDGQGEVIVCVTTPRVIHDIRTAAGSGWLETQQYVGTQRKFTSEVGMWGGVRFIKTNRMVLRNHGVVAQQTTLTAPTVPGQGAAATVDSVYHPGQTGSTRTIPVTSSSGFTVGMIVTIHSQSAGSGAGYAPVETDGTQETRRVVAVGSGTLSFDKPLLKDHASGDFVTKGLDVHGSLFLGGPGVVYGVAERPTPILPPKMDDAMMINRVGWRAYCKMQLFRPEYFEVVETAGTTD